jgi:tetratricopeptide (TPR) repeat protein
MKKHSLIILFVLLLFEACTIESTSYESRNNYNYYFNAGEVSLGSSKISSSDGKEVSSTIVKVVDSKVYSFSQNQKDYELALEGAYHIWKNEINDISKDNIIKIIFEKGESTFEYEFTYSVLFSLLAHKLNSEHKNDSAIIFHEIASKINPSEIIHIANQGTVLIEQKKYREAETKFKEAIKVNPQAGYPYFGLGRINYDTLNYTMAVNYFEKSLSKRIEPKEEAANVHGYLGASFKKLGRIEQAIEHFNKAIDLNNSEKRAYFHLGEIYLKTNKDLACTYLRRAVELGDEEAKDLINNCK